MSGFHPTKDEVSGEILDVNIVSGSASGTQYTEGDTDASITGTAILWEDAANTLTPVSEAKPLPVSATLDTTGLATETKQDTIIGHLDGVESLLTDIESAVDGLEAKDYATSAKQDTIIGHLDGVEASLSSIDTDTTTIIGHLDGVEASLSSIDTDTTTIIGHLDGVEGLLTTIDTDTGNIATSVGVLDDWDNAASDGVSISGDVAHDDADAGEPVKIGYKAIAHGANPTAVAANDRTNGYANRHGIPFFIGGHPNIQTKQLNITDADGAQTDTDILGAISSGTKYVITHITVTADGANTGDVQCRIGFGTANTPANDAAGVILSHPGIKPGSGVSIGNGAGIIGVGADGAELRVTCEDPAGGALDIVVGYYTIES